MFGSLGLNSSGVRVGLGLNRGGGGGSPSCGAILSTEAGVGVGGATRVAGVGGAGLTVAGVGVGVGFVVAAPTVRRGRPSWVCARLSRVEHIRPPKIANNVPITNNERADVRLPL